MGKHRQFPGKALPYSFRVNGNQCNQQCLGMCKFPYHGNILWKAISFPGCVIVRKLELTRNAVSICMVAVYCTLKYYMHGRLFFSKKTAVHCILECYMHRSLFFSKKKKTAVYCILECYVHGSLLFSKKNLPCIVFWNAICTAVCFPIKILPCDIFWNAICTAVQFSL